MPGVGVELPIRLYRTAGAGAPVQEGERVFTIGSPLTLDKVITTGIVSKVEPHTIMSDININPGNSGGPLYNGEGQVIGLTTFGTRGEGGRGVSGIVRIEEALSLLEQNYREQEERRLQAERAQKKRSKKDARETENADDSDAPKEWEEEAGAHPAVFGIYVMPKAKEGFGSALGVV